MRDTLQEKKQECLNLKQDILVYRKIESEKEDLESKVRVLNSDLEKGSLIIKAKEQEIEHKR